MEVSVNLTDITLYKSFLLSLIQSCCEPVLGKNVCLETTDLIMHDSETHWMNPIWFQQTITGYLATTELAVPSFTYACHCSAPACLYLFPIHL